MQAVVGLSKTAWLRGASQDEVDDGANGAVDEGYYRPYKSEQPGVEEIHQNDRSRELLYKGKQRTIQNQRVAGDILAAKIRRHAKSRAIVEQADSTGEG